MAYHMSQIELLVSEPTYFIAVLFDHAWEEANGDIRIYHAMCKKLKGYKKGQNDHKFVVSYWQNGEDEAEGSDYDVIIVDLCKGTYCIHTSAVVLFSFPFLDYLAGVCQFKFSCLVYLFSVERT